VDRRDRRVLLGRVIGVHGVRGGVKVESYTDPRDKILDYQPWIVRHNGVEQVLRAKPLIRHPKVAAALDGIEDRDIAEAMVGADICVRRAQLPAPTAGEYYWFDLEGLAVRTLDGAELGTVARVFATGANDVLVVRQGERERLIPFVQGSYVRRVDLAGGLIEVDWDPEF